jgi:hypothetical protein
MPAGLIISDYQDFLIAKLSSVEKKLPFALTKDKTDCLIFGDYSY